MMKRILPLLMLTALLGLAAGCGDKKGDAAAAPEVARDVAVAQVQRATVPDYVEAVGTVRAEQSSQLSAQIVATVASISVHEGQRVRRGEVLAVLDDAQQRAGLERATAAVTAAQQDIGASEADYALAGATLKRYQALYEKKSVSPHEMDEVEARYKAATAHRDQAGAGVVQARAMQAQANAGLSYTRIRAPFDGVVTAKFVDPGALASPGVPLLTVEDTRHFRLEATVDESAIQFVKLDSPATVTVDAFGNEEMTGKVVEIFPAADPTSRTFTLKVELPGDARLRSGLFGRARFVKGERQAILVPKTAIVDRGQLQGVYAVGADGAINLRYITLGKPVGDQVEVLSGLQPGEKVVTNPGDRELGGKRVEGRS